MLGRCLACLDGQAWPDTVIHSFAKVFHTLKAGQDCGNVLDALDDCCHSTLTKIHTNSAVCEGALVVVAAWPITVQGQPLNTSIRNEWLRVAPQDL